MQATRSITIDDFYAFIAQPENAERHFEWIDGEIVEKMVAFPYSSQVASRIGTLIESFNMQHGLGHVTTADGGYIVNGQRLIPDMGFVSYARMPELIAEKGYVKIAPDLAVEVMSPTDTARELTKKVLHYLAAGTIVIVAYPDEQELDIYAPNQPIETVKGDDMLRIESVLPGFAVAAKDCFPPRRAAVPSE